MEVDRKHQSRQLHVTDARLFPTRRAFDRARHRLLLACAVEGVLAWSGRTRTCHAVSSGKGASTEMSASSGAKPACSSPSSTPASARYASAPMCDGANERMDLPAWVASAKRIDFRTAGLNTGRSYLEPTSSRTSRA